MKTFLNACQKKNIRVLTDLQLAPRCAFKTGGSAEYFIEPTSHNDVQRVLQLIHEYNIPLTILGGGTNVLAPDDILRGVTLSMCGLAGHEIDTVHNTATIAAGMTIPKVCAWLAANQKRSIDFLYGMPGTIGGALWMNARCYGKEISQYLVSARGYSREGEPWNYTFQEKDFSYKKSPFHTMGVITQCTIRLEDCDTISIWQDMLSHEMNRHAKGHYLAPCAGSVFKNNHAFHASSGELLDTLKWKGVSYNNAQVNPHHANIIINKGNATSRDIYELSLRMQQSLYDTRGIQLEHEIILLGESSQWKK